MQVVYTGFIFSVENSCLLQLELRLMRAMRVNQNTKVAGRKTKMMSYRMLESSVELKETAELWVHHYEQPPSYYTLLLIHCNIKIIRAALITMSGLYIV